MSLFGSPTTIPNLLHAVELRLQARSGVRADRIFVTTLVADDHLTIPTADTILLIRPQSCTQSAATVDGAGRAAGRFVLQFAVEVLHRTQKDQEGRLSKGFQPMESVSFKVINGLQLFVPLVDVIAGKAIVTAPMRWLNTQWGARRLQDPTWTLTINNFEVGFVPNLDGVRTT